MNYNHALCKYTWALWGKSLQSLHALWIYKARSKIFNLYKFWPFLLWLPGKPEGRASLWWLELVSCPVTAIISGLTAKRQREFRLPWPHPLILSLVLSIPVTLASLLFLKYVRHLLSVYYCVFCLECSSINPHGCLSYFLHVFIQKSFRWNLPSTLHIFLPYSFFFFLADVTITIGLFILFLIYSPN